MSELKSDSLDKFRLTSVEQNLIEDACIPGKDSVPVKQIQLARYVFFHTVVRNDDHCPVCRRHYVTFYSDFDEAVKCASQEMEEKAKPKRIERLKKGHAVWIDEWVRRSNGDRYRISNLRPEMTHQFGGEYDQDVENGELKNNVSFMALHICIRRSEWCPENITFSVSFHTTIEKACDMGKSSLYSDEEDEDKSIIDSVEKIRNLQPVWKPCGDDEGSGNHFQIIPIECNKKMYLNEHCYQLKEWEKSR
jgi:hypothetical protein